MSGTFYRNPSSRISLEELRHASVWRGTCWTAVLNLFWGDMFYHSVCQSEVFTTHTHSDTPHTHLYKTQSQKNTTPGSPTGVVNHHLQPAPRLIGLGGGCLAALKPCVCVTNLANKGWKVAPTAVDTHEVYLQPLLKSIYSTRVLTLAVLSLNVITKSFHKWSVCKDKHPSCTISHLQSKEHLNTCSWLQASWANTCQFLSCMTSYMPLKNQPSIVRGNKGMHMQCRDV